LCSIIDKKKNDQLNPVFVWKWFT